MLLQRQPCTAAAAGTGTLAQGLASPKCTLLYTHVTPSSLGNGVAEFSARLFCAYINPNPSICIQPAPVDQHLSMWCNTASLASSDHQWHRRCTEGGSAEKCTVALSFLRGSHTNQPSHRATEPLAAICCSRNCADPCCMPSLLRPTTARIVLRPGCQHQWVEFIDQGSMAAALSSSTPSVGTPRSRATWVCRPKPPETGPARAAASPTSRQGGSESNAAHPAGICRPHGHPPPLRRHSLPALRRQTRPALLSPCTGTEDAELEANALGQQMRSWVEDAGGYIHPALALSCATPNGRWGGPPAHPSATCSRRPVHVWVLALVPFVDTYCQLCCWCWCRGIVAVEGISLDTAEQQPLIAVPESLLLTTEAADAQLGPRLWQRRLQRPAQRQPQSWWPPGGRQQQQQQRQRLQEGPPEPTLLLALLLAHERRQGSASRWWPYIAALPEEPPCGWALGQQQLNASLEVLGGLAQGWAPQVAAASSAVGQRAEAAAAAYGAELGLSAGDVRWALGHVVSRCFGSGAAAGWERRRRLAVYLAVALATQQRGCVCGTAGCRHWRHGLCRPLQASANTAPAHALAPSSAPPQALSWRCCPSSTCATTGSTLPSQMGEGQRGGGGTVAAASGDIQKCSVCCMALLSGACPFQPGVSKFDIHPSAQAPITAGTLVEKTNPARRCTAACRARHRRCQLAPSCALVMWQVGGWAPAAAAGGGTWPRPLQRSPGARSCPAAEWRAICRLPCRRRCCWCLLVSACRHRSPHHVPALPCRRRCCCWCLPAGTAPLNMFLNFGFVPEEHRAK